MTYKLEDLLEPPSPSSVDDPASIELPEYLLNDPEIVGYDDLEFQDSIYKWVVGNLHGSIKDYGCGRGDFWKSMSQPWSSGNLYIGIDSNTAMIRAGEQKYPGLTFVNSDWFDVDTVTKHTVCVGSLNIDSGQDKWTYFVRTLNHAIATTTDSVIFVLNISPQEGLLDYDIPTVTQLVAEYPFTIDCSKFEGICKVTVYCQKFQ